MYYNNIRAFIPPFVGSDDSGGICSSLWAEVVWADTNSMNIIIKRRIFTDMAIQFPPPCQSSLFIYMLFSLRFVNGWGIICITMTRRGSQVRLTYENPYVKDQWGNDL